MLPSSAGYGFIGAFVALGFGGSLSFFSAFQVHPSFLAISRSCWLINVFFDMSAIVPLLPYVLYRHLGWQRATVFAAFAGYVLVVHAAWMTLWRRHVQIKCGLADEEPASEATPPEAEEEAHAKVEPRPATPWSSTIPPVPEGIPFWQLTCSHQFLAGGFWFVANAWRSNFYLGEVKYMLRALGDNDATYISYFSALLVLAVPFIPCIAAATDRLGVPAAMQACTAIAAVHAAFALVPSLPFQLATFVVYTLLRAAIFSVVTIYAAHVFRFARLRMVLGLWQVVAAVAGFSTPFITDYILEVRGGNWSPLLLVFLWLCLPQALAVVYVTSSSRATVVGIAHEAHRRPGSAVKRMFISSLSDH